LTIRRTSKDFPEAVRRRDLIRAFGESLVTRLIRPSAANLWAGVRNAFFVRVNLGAWVASPGLLIALIVALIALTIVLNRTFYGGSVAFNWGALRILSADVPVILFVGWLTAWFARRRVSALVVSVAIVAALITMEVVTNAVSHVAVDVLPRKTYQVWSWIYVAYYAWFIVVVAVFARRSALLSWRHMPIVLLPLVCLGTYDMLVPPQPLWYYAPAASSGSSEARAEWPAAEELLYSQPKLAEHSINILAKQRRGVPDIYFVGFAPYAHEDVFLQESEVIRNLMDDRFDTYGRSLLLVNNGKTLRQYPLATVTNLRAALQRIGRLMDPNEDVLVLYLTSHGSNSHQLSVSYWPLDLQQLDPPLVKQLLDDAGIRWRVVIVSACYSGGFIEPLRGPTTLVITAADATHTSFGCGADSDFTYFAKALFDEELRQTFSFAEAFARAVVSIRSREQTEQQEFSNPQIAMGEEIGAKLASIERRLASLPANVAQTRRHR
jgi:peptidase C13-like protein